MSDELLEWIRKLIREDNLHDFYTSKVWRNAQERRLKEEHYECRRCRKKGLVVRARTVHHTKYLKEYPELALDDENLEPICDECHYDEHHRKKSGFVNEERW